MGHLGWRYAKSQNTVRGSKRQCASPTSRGPIGTKLAYARLFVGVIRWVASGCGFARRVANGRLRRGHWRGKRNECRAGFDKNAIGPIFYDAQNQKWNRRSGDQKLSSAWSFGFGLPAEDLCGQEEGEACPAPEGEDLRVTARGSGRVYDGLLEAIDEVGGR